MFPRFMQVYSPPFYGQIYNEHKRRSHLPIILGNEIVEISEQDNIETLLRYFQYVANIVFFPISPKTYLWKFSNIPRQAAWPQKIIFHPHARLFGAGKLFSEAKQACLAQENNFPGQNTPAWGKKKNFRG